ncbi:ATP-dependent nuclease [Nocardia brasiliensis]|uniref:ATP-dependent nuclease n=1 Tax=Nocardia brasiliensis TaxID=37326 RepID=UPI003799CA3A
MKFVCFRIEKFRNILNSGWIAVNDITCLVGKNESGKTALLQALYRLNPAFHAKFNPNEHYPRRLLTNDKRAGTIDQAKAVTGIFELSDDDIKCVETYLGAGSVQSRVFEFTRGYNGTEATVKLDAAAILDNIFETAGSSEAIRDRFADIADLDSLRIAVSDATDSVATGTDTSPLLAELNALGVAISVALADAHSAHERAISVLNTRMPTFFYFSDYSILPGRISLAAIDEIDSSGEADGLRTAQALLHAAGTTTDALRSEDFEDRTVALEALGNELTAQVFEFWSQSEQLEIKIDVDRLSNASPGRTCPAPEHNDLYLDIRVKDRRHGFTCNFSRRSEGFQWFFSFVAAFSEFEGKDVVVLLDEPGLKLHARAQSDLMQFIETRLAPSVQVIYTTHSPYMINAAELDRIRVVEDIDSNRGTIVSARISSGSRDTLVPLHSALGFHITRNLSDGPGSLYVRDTTYLTYCTIISRYLKSLGRRGLHDSWRIRPIGDWTDITASAALLGHNFDVTILTNASVPGLRDLSHPKLRTLLSQKRIVTIQQITGTEQTDIEDLFEPSDYLMLYNRATRARLRPNQLPPGAGIVDRITKARGATFIERSEVADLLLHDRLKAVTKLRAVTLANFEALFTLINATRPDV